MPYKVAIRENATGEVRLYQSDMDWDETEDHVWLDGNFPSECNRNLLFHQAYTVLYAELPDGSRIELHEPHSA